MAETVDVLVIGAGPAGSTIARLLASQDYSVLLLKGPPPREPLAETLPPSMQAVLETAGIRRCINNADFYPDRGNTTWWGAEPRIENYPGDARAWHVERRHLHGLLLSLAENAGAIVRRNSRAPRVALEVGAVEHDAGVSSARFVIDASGRAGLLARQIKRYWDPRYRTIAVCGIVRANRPWNVDPHHTLTEAYESGWAYSVPLAPDRRHVCFVVDTASARGGVEQAWHAELERAPNFGELFADSISEWPPWGRDVSLYYSDRCAGSNWMLVGDAASFSDPIRSHGLENAIGSACAGAAVVNTCLSDPDRAGAAIEQYNIRQSATWLDRARAASRRFAEGEVLFGTSFWRERAQPPV